jgi:hypothetical protein
MLKYIQQHFPKGFAFQLHPPKNWAAMSVISPFLTKKIEGATPEEALKNWMAFYKTGLVGIRRLR